ncbi:MAG: OprO/OprP family phosphate-selective porin [Tannerellaceae bacterium]|nr:OprO/OprP family phosphate-selective porin [Tannerellaceae bacterium]
MKRYFLTLWLLFVCTYTAVAENSATVPPVDIRLSGRLFLDGGFFLSSPEELHSGTHIPEIRLGAKIKINPGWYTKIDMGFANGKAALKDAYVEYGMNDNYYRAGYMLGFYSIDQSISSNDLVFNTGANSAETFYPGRHLGLSFSRSVMHYYFSLGAFMGDKINYTESIKPGTNLTARLVWRPVNDGVNTWYISEVESRSG